MRGSGAPYRPQSAKLLLQGHPEKFNETAIYIYIYKDLEPSFKAWEPSLAARRGGAQSLIAVHGMTPAIAPHIANWKT